MQYPYSKAVLDDSLITVDATSLDQHELYYYTIALSRCEIYDCMRNGLNLEIRLGHAHE